MNIFCQHQSPSLISAYTPKAIEKPQDWLECCIRHYQGVDFRTDALATSRSSFAIATLAPVVSFCMISYLMAFPKVAVCFLITITTIRPNQATSRLILSPYLCQAALEKVAVS